MKAAPGPRAGDGRAEGAQAQGAPVLFFEPSHQGHVALHVTRLVAALVARPLPGGAVFAISRALHDRLDAPTRAALDTAPGLSADLLEAGEARPCIAGGAIATGRARWALAGTRARRHGARHVFFLLLDTALIGAILARRDDPIRAYSGILFRPRLHLAPGGGAGTGGMTERIKTLRQWPYYAAALAGRRLETMWTLDPFFPEYAARRLPGRGKVQFLSEEAIVPAARAATATPPAATATPPEDRVRFLLYGVLKARKGILHVLDACLRLPAREAARIELRLMGECVTEDRAAIAARLARLAADRPELRIVSADRFLAEDELIAEIADADVILAPYVGHIGSSGVVYNAALQGKALLACREGLIGALVSRYDLGHAVDPADADALCAAMVALLDPDTRLRTGPRRRAYLDLNAPIWTTRILSELSTEETAS